jgi:hypothetical protein
MFSNLSLGRVPIEVQINLAQRDSFYTNQSCVSGDIVLDAKCSVNITTIVVTLSGAAISRLGSQGSSEIHQVQAYILPQSTKCLTYIFSSSKGRRGSFLQRFCPKSAPDLIDGWQREAYLSIFSHGISSSNRISALYGIGC